MGIRRRADTSLLFQVVVALLLADTSSDRDRPECTGEEEGPSEEGWRKKMERKGKKETTKKEKRRREGGGRQRTKTRRKEGRRRRRTRGDRYQ